MEKRSESFTKRVIGMNDSALRLEHDEKYKKYEQIERGIEEMLLENGIEAFNFTADETFSNREYRELTDSSGKKWLLIKNAPSIPLRDFDHSKSYELVPYENEQQGEGQIILSINEDGIPDETVEDLKRKIEDAGFKKESE